MPNTIAKIEIIKSLVLSTAHVKEEELAVLERTGEHQFSYGAVAEISLLPRGLSKDFYRCVDLAKKYDCDRIEFDRDGPVVEDLPTFKWD